MSLASLDVHDDPELRKARGAFFTPDRVAEFVTRWAVRTSSDVVLEPSCGEAAFLVQAARRLRSLRADPGASYDSIQLFGVELHDASARTAKRLVESEGEQVSITTSDFFLVEPANRFDVVIGNPPYVRYQEFAGPARERSRSAAIRAGVNLTALASSWAAFTVHAALFLKTGGRMGLVLPAELLSVNYAAQVRRFLMETFREVSIVLFEERVFPGVLEEVVLLLADGYKVGSANHASIFQVRNPDQLASDLSGYRWTPSAPDAKWTPSLLASDAHAAYEGVVGSVAFTGLETWGDTTLGMVTGNNKFFTLSPERFRQLELSRDDVLPLSPPGSRHLRGLDFTKRTLCKLGAEGARTLLFRPSGAPSDAAAAYIDAGHLAGIDDAYKCRVRTPWWRVPRVPVADLLLTYMNSDTPRITTNRAAAHHLNSVHGVYLRPEHRILGRDVLSLAALNSVTMLGAEIVGRSYGGGMLKLEPREADSLPVPSPELVKHVREGLLQVRPAVARRLRSSDLLGASAIVDEVLMQQGAALNTRQLERIRVARGALAARRIARGAEPRVS